MASKNTITIDGVTVWQSTRDGTDYVITITATGANYSYPSASPWVYSGTGTFLGFSTTQGATTPDSGKAVGDNYTVTVSITLYSVVQVVAVPYLTTDQELTSVANAIRTKGGTSAALEYPAEFISAIGAIQTGTPKAAQTYYPSTGDQIIESGYRLTGTQRFKGVLLTNLSADNIKKDVVVKVGDSADDDRITSVTGTYEGSGGGTTTVNISVGMGEFQVYYSNESGSHIDSFDGGAFPYYSYQCTSGSLITVLGKSTVNSVTNATQVDMISLGGKSAWPNFYVYLVS